MKVRWLHISDFHFRGGDPYDSDVVLGALVSSVEKFRKSGRRPDLIFATGDIADRGQDEEYAVATRFFNALLAAADIKKERLFIIPGNHDVDRELGYSLLRTLDSNEAAQKYFKPKVPKPHISQKQRAFCNWYGEYFSGIRSFQTDSTCGSVESVTIGDFKVGILPINSALFCQDDNDHGKLWIGRRCIDAALAELDDLKTDVNIALVHHPLQWLNDDESGYIRATLATKVDLVLRGHLHKTELETVDGTSGKSVNLAAGAAYQTSKWPNRAIYGSIEGGDVVLFPIAYQGDPRPVWTVDTSLFPDNVDFQGKYSIARLGQTGEMSRINGYKLYYYRTTQKLSFSKLSALCGVDRRRLHRLELVSSPKKGGLNTECFKPCDRDTISRIEAALGCPSILEAGKADDRLSQYMSFYENNHRRQTQSSRSVHQLELAFQTKIVVYDFDGTLTQRNDDLTTWEKIWVSLGYSINDCAEYFQQYRRGQISHQKWCDITCEKFAARDFNEKRLDGIAKDIQLMPGVGSTIKGLNERGIKQYILSGSIKKIIFKVLGDFRDSFEEIRANDMAFSKDGVISSIIGTKFDFEEKRDFIDRLISDHGCSPEDVLFVGNSCNDVWAIQSGARTLCVNPHFTDPSNPEHWTYCITRMTSLEEILPFVRI